MIIRGKTMSYIKKIIRERHRETSIFYEREFQLIGDYKGNGYCFPCNKDGTPNISDQFYDCWKGNFQYCLDHPEKYEDMGCVERKQSFTEPAYVRCSCGEEFYLNGDTECPNCGQWYNGSGQELLPPEYWEDDDGYYLEG
jgi:hypothetical protein